MNVVLSGCSVVAVIVLICPAAIGHYRGDPSLRRDVPRNDLQASNLQIPNTKHSLLRGTRVKENVNLLHKNDFPPKSASPSIEALLLRGEAVLRAIRDEGCPASEETFYNITVYTADLRLAGTTSLVYINLYGEMYGLEESTAKIRLTNNHDNEFNRGRVDSFVVKTKFVGIVRRVTIEHDNTGFFPDWNLDKIEVHDLKLGTVQTFVCDCEMAGYENQHTLPPI